MNSLSNADDMVLLAPTVTPLQTLLEVCRAYAGPHNIVYNTTKIVCMLIRPKQSQGQYSTRVRVGNEELSFVEEFRYLGHVMTADCRYDKDIKTQFRRQNAVGNMLVRKFSFAPIEAKIQLFNRVARFMDALFGGNHTRTLLESLLSVIVTPYQCGIPQICLQLDEKSNSFLQQYCYCHCQ